MDVYSYWRAVLEQDAASMRDFFRSDAVVNWHNTNERFNLEEFIRANCEYPGEWCGEVERVEIKDDLIVTVTHVWSVDKGLSFHVTSFIKTQQDKIILIDEYWGDDGPAPQWRRDKKLGCPIK